MTALHDVPGETAGFATLDHILRVMPDSARINLQRVIRANYRDHLKAVEARSTGLRPAARRNVARSFHIQPDTSRTPRRLADVFGDSATFWKGDQAGAAGNPAKGVPRRLEKRVGRESHVSPKAGKLLAVPIGSLRTAGGAVKRKGKARVQVRDQANTHVVRTKRGQLLVVQRRGRGASRGRRAFNEQAAREAKGQHERLVGLLLPRAAVTKGLDYFGSWDSLARARDERYGRLLNDIVDGRITRGAAR